ncbi:carbohydrate ABC transporter permease [Actinopolymorpha alba]|uniref:carbohydrate ABC transporter permease n=1 Tax=Actinopolymorpha alba TaxID=533267 RepID=UPI000373B405|nr:carbohydrate ABC transporter permease [Actinopolymorpha alba]
MTAAKRIGRGLTTIALSLVALAAVYPILFMATGSLKRSLEFMDDPIGLPRNWLNFENFIALGNRFDVVRILANTAGYAACALVVTLVLAVPASYALAKLRFAGSQVILGLVVASMGIPIIAILVPNYLFFVGLGFGDSPVSVIGMWVARALPGSIFLITAVIRVLPDELIEAAKVDGATYRRVMLDIVVPLSVPGFVTASIFNLTGWWNDLLVPLVFLHSDEKQTLTASIASLGQRLAGADYPLSMAALLVSSAAPMLLYVVLQSYVRRGLVMGSVK